MQPSSYKFAIPRKMCRNFHEMSCRSLAISSCAGGCIVKSYRTCYPGKAGIYAIDKFIAPSKLFQRYEEIVHTSGGNIFSAARRGTENPPCVLVSLAVSVLQKNSVGCLFCFRPSSDASIASRSYCKY
jgi:hypothetical protein